MRMLVIEDEDIIRGNLAAFFSDLSFTVFEAENGRVGIDTFLRELPDIVLVDLRMPEVDGLDVLSAVREHSPETPIIIVSGTGVMEDAIEALRRGAWDFVLKPITDMAILEHAVRMALEKARLVRENRLYREQLEKDITERSTELDTSREETRTQNVFLRSVMDSLPYPFCVIDAKSLRVKLANAAAGKVAGELCHAAVHGLEETCCEPSHNCPLNAVVETGESQTVTHIHHDEEGNAREVEINCFPVIDQRGSVSHVIEYHIDITDRKELEAQLLHSQRMESVGRFAGGVAHDLNNILSAIMGYSELAALEKSDDPHIREYMGAIMEGGERAAALTRQLLAFSRKQVLQVQVINLGQVLEDFTKMLHRVIGDDVKLEINIDSSPSNVLADPSQVEQILMNLAVNARDAMPDGGRLTIGVENVSLDEISVAHLEGGQPGSYVCLSVTDTGFGMTKEVKEKIFESFYTTKEVGEGTGLGLSTVYGIVRQHNSYIHVYSEPGTGTSFRIYFPVCTKKEDLKDAGARLAVVGGKEAVLAVDDDPSIVRLIEKILSPLGYRVLAATSAGEALELADGTSKIDVLLTDITMPDMNGIQLAEEIEVRRKNVKVVFMSGYMDRSHFAEAMEQAKAVFLPKPFSRGDLTHIIRWVMENQGEPAGSV
jgi:signal transduction histidine kinase/DNA-binding response OmpR family regulator